jgi:hypothetical protein
VFTHKVPGFPNLEEADIEEVLDPHGADLIEVFFFFIFYFYVEHLIVMKIHNE